MARLDGAWRAPPCGRNVFSAEPRVDIANLAGYRIQNGFGGL
jgi:hypothetical protein